jgi:gliding motility-associated protein GldL
MGALDFTQKYWWKNFIHKLYSWGASIVLVGALFKITHWPGATIMLTIGLLTEAVIFFFSGIEPPHEEIDWTLVYPELKVSEESEEDILSSSSSGRSIRKGTEVAAPSVEAIQKFDEMLEKAGEEGLFDKLHEGLNKLNNNIVKMSEMSDASVATKEFTDKVKTAAENVSKFGNTMESSAESINYSADNLADAFNKTSQTVSSHKEKLDNAYSNLVSSMDIDFQSLGKGNEEYNEKISLLNKNLTAINAIFEMQLEDANLDQMVKDIQESAVYAKKYSDEITKLSKNLSALNNVYGKMLSAMNIQVD